MSTLESDRKDALDSRWMHSLFFLWHAAFALLIVTILIGMPSAHTAWPGYPLVAVLCVAYVGLLLPAMKRESRRFGISYLAVAIPATLGLGYLYGPGLNILYAVFPHIFVALEGMRIRIPLILGLAAASVGVLLHSSDLGSALITIGAALLVSMLLSVLMQIPMREADRRGDLIRQLEAARADLDAAHREAGVLAERQRLSHEIHDTLAQGFTSLLMLIQAADSTVERDPRATHERLALAESTARENLAEARALVAALAPAPLQAAPLDTALERITTRFGEELGLETGVKILGTPRELPADVQVVLLRAAQEAMANIRKHAAASASCVQVRLGYRTHSVLLEVQDDGPGFTEEGGAASFGLRGMRSRVEQVSGILEVESAPGAGTTVRLEIP